MSLAMRTLKTINLLAHQDQASSFPPVVKNPVTMDTNGSHGGSVNDPCLHFFPLNSIIPVHQK